MERPKDPVSTCSKAQGGETFYVLISEQLETPTLESKNTSIRRVRVAKLMQLANSVNLFIFSTSLAEQQRRGAAGALLLLG